LSLADIIKKNNFEVDLLNVDLLRLNDEQVIDYIKKYNPLIIGWSAVTSTSYKYIKTINFLIRKHFGKKVKIILGGNLCASAELLITKCHIDVVFIGTSEDSLDSYLKNFDNNIELKKIKGIAFIENDKIIFTGYPEYKKDLNNSSLIKDFSLIDTDFYMPKISDAANNYYIDNRLKKLSETKKRMINIMLIRGCQNSCTFCHRNVLGIQQRTVDECIKYIEFLRDKFDIYFFRLNSESFIIKKNWILEFAEKIKKLDVLFDINGARVDCVDEEIIKKLKDAGMIAIDFGYESGNQKMLNVMAKNVKVLDNLKAAKLAEKFGLTSIPQIIVGMPGENISTLNETLYFLEELKQEIVSINYAQILPGTSLYYYALYNKLITDEEQYLLSINNTNAADEKFFLNCTNYHSSVIKYFVKKMRFIAKISKENFIFRFFKELKFDSNELKIQIWRLIKKSSSLLEFFSVFSVILFSFGIKINNLRYNHNSKNLRQYMREIGPIDDNLTKIKLGL